MKAKKSLPHLTKKEKAKIIFFNIFATIITFVLIDFAAIGTAKILVGHNYLQALMEGKQYDWWYFSTIVEYFPEQILDGQILIFVSSFLVPISIVPAIFLFREMV